MKTNEELEELVRQALKKPLLKHPLVVEIGRLPESQNRATRACEILGLSKKDLVLARWVAVHKSGILKENPKADYSQVLEEIKNKESKMEKTSDFKKRVEELRERIRVTELKEFERREGERRKSQEKEKENIERILSMVIMEFERKLEAFQTVEIDQFPFSQEFKIEWWDIDAVCGRAPNRKELEKLKTALEEIGFKFKDLEPEQLSEEGRHRVEVTLNRKVTGDSIV